MNVSVICDENGKHKSKLYSRYGIARGQFTQMIKQHSYVPTKVYENGQWVPNLNYEADVAAKIAKFDRWSIVTYELVEVSQIFGSDLVSE